MPEYAYCESIYAIANSPWHIRQLRADETEPTRRVFELFEIPTDAPALCGCVTGQDIIVTINECHNDYTCPKCLEAYVQADRGSPRHEPPPDAELGKEPHEH